MGYDDEETSKRSIFNAGVAMAERIDSLQRAINSSRFNPTSMNLELNKFNYEIMVSANDGLLAEAWSKLSDDEMERGSRIKKIVHHFVEMNPIIVNVNGEMKVNKKNYKQFMELIDIYEKTNKLFLDEHGMNAPNYDEDDGL